MIETLVVGIILGPALHLSIRVNGGGYLRFAREGRIVYAKSAILEVKGGLLCDGRGAVVIPQMEIPDGCTRLDFDANGFVVAGTLPTLKAVGRIILATFPNENALKPSGAYLISSDRSTNAYPGEGPAGLIIDSERPVASSLPAKTAAAHDESFTGRAIVTVRAASQVKGPTFTLGEIADIKAAADQATALAAVRLGSSPAVGAVRDIELWEVKSRLKVAKIDPLTVAIDMPLKATVTVKSQAVSFAKLAEIAQAGIKEKLGNLPLASPDAQADVDAPIGAVDVRFESCTKSEKFVTAQIGIYVDGKRVNVRTLNFAPGAPAEGVHAGDGVTIVIVSGGASIEVPGHVRSSGWVGQTVTVLTETGTTHTGTVVAKGRIEVRL